MSELEQQTFEFMVGSMEEVGYWWIHFNYPCRVRNPQNRGNPPVPCKHCINIEEHTEVVYPWAKGSPKDIIKMWVCPRVIETSGEGCAVLCLDCVLEAAKFEIPIGKAIEQILERVKRCLG